MAYLAAFKKRSWKYSRNVTSAQPVAGITNRAKPESLSDAHLSRLIGILREHGNGGATRFFLDLEPCKELSVHAVNALLRALHGCTVYLYTQGHGAAAREFVPQIEVPEGVEMVFAIPTYGGTTLGGAQSVVAAIHARAVPARFCLILEDGTWGEHFGRSTERQSLVSDGLYLGEANWRRYHRRH